MEFKDKLKELRAKRGLSQQKLADAIFVSRSAVAKWECGLGLPSASSYEGLIAFFEISERELPLGESEHIIVKKNRTIRKLILNFSIFIALYIAIVLSVKIPLMIDEGYGFTSRLAAGEEFEYAELIETEDYDFYILPFTEHIEIFSAVKRVGLRYERIIFEPKHCYDADGVCVGMIYQIKGEECFYNIFKPTHFKEGDKREAKSVEL